LLLSVASCFIPGCGMHGAAGGKCDRHGAPSSSH
jgi:hypothetical protein